MNPSDAIALCSFLIASAALIVSVRTKRTEHYLALLERLEEAYYALYRNLKHGFDVLEDLRVAATHRPQVVADQERGLVILGVREFKTMALYVRPLLSDRFPLKGTLREADQACTKALDGIASVIQRCKRGEFDPAYVNGVIADAEAADERLHRLGREIEEARTKIRL